MNDWLDSFYTFAMLKEPPPLYAKWAAVSTLASLVQRKQWYMFKGSRSYFNLYIIICGPPTAGKGLAVGPMREVLSEFDQQFIAPDSLTAASLADELEDAAAHVIDNDGNIISQHPLVLLISELGNFLPEYDKNTMNRLIKLWDGEGWEERRRGTGKKMQIRDAHLNMFAGTTPAYFANTLPDSAWEEGFMSRTVVVYFGEGSKNDFFEEAPEANKTLRAQIIKDARKISDKTGRIYWTKEALKAVNDWQRGGCAPLPSHPKLQFYNGRRFTNLLKLCGLSAISRGSHKVEEQDFRRMLDLLIETEQHLPDIFKAMRSGGDQQVIKETWHFIFTSHLQTKKPVDRALVYRFLQERVPTHNIERIIDVMIQAKFIKVTGGTKFVPISNSAD